MAALARVHLGRVLRAVGDWTTRRGRFSKSATAWHRAAGGGEQALLGECLLAAMDAADEIPGCPRATRPRSSTPPELNDEAHVEVFALDALARAAAEAGDIETARDLSESADRRMEVARPLHHRARPH